MLSREAEFVGLGSRWLSGIWGRKEAVLLTKRKYEEVGRELNSRQTGFQQLQQANKVARSCQWRGTDQKSREKLAGGIRSWSWRGADLATGRDGLLLNRQHLSRLSLGVRKGEGAVLEKFGGLWVGHWGRPHLTGSTFPVGEPRGAGRRLRRMVKGYKVAFVGTGKGKWPKSHKRLAEVYLWAKLRVKQLLFCLFLLIIYCMFLIVPWSFPWT